MIVHIPIKNQYFSVKTCFWQICIFIGKYCVCYWNSIGFHWILLECIVFYWKVLDFYWILVEVSGHGPLDPARFYWNSIGFSWNVLVFIGKYWIFIGIILGFSWNVLLFIGKYWIFIGFVFAEEVPKWPAGRGKPEIIKINTFLERIYIETEHTIFWILLEFYWILLKCISFYWKVLDFYWNYIGILLKCIGFYWKVLDFYWICICGGSGPRAAGSPKSLKSIHF